jgi:hypothetical protein
LPRGDEIARFLEQATFGPSLADITSFDTESTSFAHWIQQQQESPIESHRAFYRTHLNARYDLPSNQGLPTFPCDEGTRYRRAAFSSRDYRKMVEIEETKIEIVEGVELSRMILRMEGQIRTVVNATLSYEAVATELNTFGPGA